MVEPADNTALQIASAGNGDFNTSRTYGQLSHGPLKGSQGLVNSGRTALLAARKPSARLGITALGCERQVNSARNS